MIATPFITIDEVLPFFGIGLSMGEEERTELQLTINAVCNLIEKMIRRPVVAHSLQAFSDGGSDKIILKPTVFSISSVVENGSPLGADQYALYPDVAYLVRKSGAARGQWASGVQTVIVTYTAGVAELVTDVPPDLKLAAKMAVKHYHKVGPMAFGTEYRGDSYFREDTFPRPALKILDQYKVVE